MWVKVAIFDLVFKGSHECPFYISVRDRCAVRRKMGDREPALRVLDEEMLHEERINVVIFFFSS